MTKRRKKRVRSQGRKLDIITPLPAALDEHADAIRALACRLARRSFDDIVEIGRRLAR
jgi:hypothetical protein